MKNTGKYLTNLTMETLNMYDVEFVDAEQYAGNPVEVDDDSVVVVPQLIDTLVSIIYHPSYVLLVPF